MMNVFMSESLGFIFRVFLNKILIFLRKMRMFLNRKWIYFVIFFFYIDCIVRNCWHRLYFCFLLNICSTVYYIKSILHQPNNENNESEPPAVGGLQRIDGQMHKGKNAYEDNLKHESIKESEIVIFIDVLGLVV